MLMVRIRAHHLRRRKEEPQRQARIINDQFSQNEGNHGLRRGGDRTRRSFVGDQGGLDAWTDGRNGVSSDTSFSRAYDTGILSRRDASGMKKSKFTNGTQCMHKGLLKEDFKFKVY
jgi:hypothetical protein